MPAEDLCNRMKVVAVAAICFLACVGAASSQSDWTARASGTTEVLNAITYGAGLYVTVGERGAILTSPNAVTWASRTSGTTETLRGITYAAGQFVVVGFQGTVLTSPDGITWTSRSTGITSVLSGVAYGAGRYVAVGGSGKILTSNDAVTWTPVPTLNFNFLQGVFFGDGKFIAFGASGTRRVSTDGLAWTTIAPTTSGYLTAGCFYDSKYYITGQSGRVLSSSDLVTWTIEDSGTTSWLTAMATDGVNLIACGAEGKIIGSSNGSAWTAGDSKVSASLNGACFANGLFVVVGDLSGNSEPSGTILTAPPSPLVPPTTPYDNWKATNFTVEEQADPSISGPAIDVDGDGLTNIAEFVHGLNPKTSDTHSMRLPALVYPDNNGNSQLTWTQNQTAAASVTMVVQYSDSLQIGEWQTLDVIPEVLSSEAMLDTVNIIDATTSDSPRRFYRLEYTLSE